MRSTIREGIQQAFTLHYGEIEAAVYAEWPNTAFYDAVGIMGALAANLHRYRRSPDERFILWATAWVKRQARRYRFLTESLQNNHQLVYAMVERSLYQCSGQDWAVEPCDHEANLYLYLLQKPKQLDRMMKPKRAKPTTMLCGKAKSRMRAYRKFVSDRHYKVSSELAKFHAVVREIADSEPTDEQKEKMSAVA